MKENKEIAEMNEPVKKTNKSKTILLSICGFLLVALVALTLGGVFSPPVTDPMAVFVTDKQCSFLVMGDDVHKAVCTDGTVYDVVQIGSPSLP